MLGRPERPAVDRVLFRHEVCERDGDAVLHETCGRPGLLRGDQVQCATLVLRAPAAPVLQLGLPALERLEGDQDRRVLRGRMYFEPLLHALRALCGGLRGRESCWR